MSTHQTTHHPHQLKTRIRRGLPTLGAAVAIGFSILTLALTGTGRGTDSTSRLTATPSLTATAAHRPFCYFRDPTTHALLRIRRHHGRCSLAPRRA